MAGYEKLDGRKVKDPEDNSCIHIYVENNAESGTKTIPGIHVVASGDILNFESVRNRQSRKKEFHFDYLAESDIRTGYDDSYIKHFLLTGEKVNAKISVKVRSKNKEIIKEYILPFVLED